MTENDKQQQRWQGDWKPEEQEQADKDADRRWHAGDLARTLLIAHGDDPKRVLVVLTETFGEVGREEALKVIERMKR
jgi:hypothetical protein